MGPTVPDASCAICAVVTRTESIGTPVGPTWTASMSSVPVKLPTAAGNWGIAVVLMVYILWPEIHVVQPCAVPNDPVLKLDFHLVNRTLIVGRIARRIVENIL